MPRAAQEERHALILNLTSGEENLHAAWMGLQLAEFATLDHDVTVFFNVRAPYLATVHAPEGLAFGDKSIREKITALQSAGARLVVCPACAGAMGYTEDDLLPGIAFADREAIFGPLSRRSAVVFSY